MTPSPIPPRDRSLRLFLSLAAGVAGALFPKRAKRPSPFVLERLRVELPALTSPLRIAFLADLHFGPNVGEPAVAGWVDRSLAERPDLVLLGGDLVDRRSRPVEGLLGELRRLHAPLGVYAVWGNNDHARFTDLSPFADALRSAGVQLLVNRGTALRSDLFLAGIDDYMRGRPDAAAALAGRPPDAATLLLSHNPDVLPELPPGIDLTLCGHTHGGQICLPLVGPLVTSSHYGRRFAQGWVDARPAGGGASADTAAAGAATADTAPARRAYVSRGLGTSSIPLRVACPAELTLLDLVPVSRSGNRTGEHGAGHSTSHATSHATSHSAGRATSLAASREVGASRGSERRSAPAAAAASPGALPSRVERSGPC